MASTINASNSGFGGIVSTGDSSGQLQLQTANTTAVTIDTSQNIGIGTTTPGMKLDVSQPGQNTTALFRNTNASWAADIGVTYEPSGSRVSYYGISPRSDGSVWTTSLYGAMTFNTGPSGVATERMRIDSSGNVIVGKTSQIVDELFGVDQTGASKPAIIARAATTGTPAIKTIKTTNVNNTTQYHLVFTYNNGGNGNGAIVGNGDSQAAFATFSDSRLKKNIEDLPSQLDKINALRPVEFDYIKSGEHQIGFIAQEVREVYPDLVAEGEDTMLTVTGLGKTEARLIKAIQEQQTIINDLKARIETLESK